MKTVFILLSVLLYAASFPKPAWWWFSFIALIPLFLTLERTRLTKTLGLMTLWAAAHAAAMGYWLFFALVAQYEVAVPTAVLFICLFMVLPVCILYFLFALGFHFFYRNSLVFYALVLPSLWVMIDFAKSRIPFLIPWGDIGYAAVAFLPYVQVADTGGIYGVSFLIVTVNGLGAYLFRSTWGAIGAGERRRKKVNQLKRSPAFGAAICLLILAILGPVAYGGYRIEQIDGMVSGAKSAGGIRAVIVQGNFRSSDRWSGMGFSNRLKSYLEMSREALGDGPRVTVWPETVLNASDVLDDSFFMQMMQWVGSDSLLITGGVHSGAADGPDAGSVYNSAYLISGQGRLLRYDKQILLPYAEAVPIIDLLGRYYTAPENFRSGRTPSCMQTPLGAFGTSICLEILYPEFIRKTVNQGAEVLVNLSNDAWFGRSAMPYLHLDAARMRAIENRRYLLRAANSGISALIGPDGRVMEKTGLFERQRINGRFLPIQQATVYSRFGEWVILLAAGIIALSATIRAARSMVPNSPGAAG